LAPRASPLAPFPYARSRRLRPARGPVRPGRGPSMARPSLPPRSGTHGFPYLDVLGRRPWRARSASPPLPVARFPAPAWPRLSAARPRSPGRGTRGPGPLPTQPRLAGPGALAWRGPARPPCVCGPSPRSSPRRRGVARPACACPPRRAPSLPCPGVALSSASARPPAFSPGVAPLPLAARNAQHDPDVCVAHSRHVSVALRAHVLAWCAWCFGTARRALGALVYPPRLFYAR
jgi:hypothetical protein